MFFHLKIIIRNLQRGGIYSCINVGGLAIGMAAAILIVSWIYHEWSYDRFHAKEKSLYVAYSRAEFDGELRCWDQTPAPMGPALKTDYPEIVGTARMTIPPALLFAHDNTIFKIQTGFTDPDFLTMFDFPLLHGNAENALNDPYSLILTEKTATRLFGRENPVGKTLMVNNQDIMTITGVMKDLPGNTWFEFEALAPFPFIKTLGRDIENWGSNSLQTFVELHPKAKLNLVNESIVGIINAHTNDQEFEVFLYPLGKKHLYSRFENGAPVGGLIETLRLFAMIAGLIIFIACINFMNLSTARSRKRAKEVGVRKVLGGKRWSLIGLFLKESMLVSFIAGATGLIIALMVLPLFETLMGQQLFLNLKSAWFWLAILSFILFTCLLAGGYPAFYLSSFRPVKVLKGVFRTKQRVISSRKVLVVVQFTVAIALIVSTLVIHRQISYAQNRDTGYDKDQVIYIQFEGEIKNNFELIKQDLLNSGTAISVTKTMTSFSRGRSNTWGVWWKGKDEGARILFEEYFIDAGWTKTMGTTIIEGRDIDIYTFATDSNAMLLNESAARIMNFENPIGETVYSQGSNWHIVGVVKDFIIRSPYDPVRPAIIGGPAGRLQTMHIKLNGNNRMTYNLAQADRIFKQYNPAYPFEYFFVDEEYARKFQSEQKTGSLVSWFAGLTIFISCMGLFALVAYMAETRRKEIGIRKVLGASVYDITALLSKEFLILVSISIAVSTPIAWWAMEKWLSNYAYRTDIPWWLFVVVGGMSLCIALATVGFQAVKAAMEKPVNAIMGE